MIPLPTPETGIWTDDEPLECVMVLPETPSVKTFAFRPPSGRTFLFRAGQFITLELPVPGGPVWRTYTISSAPTSNVYISVTVKVQPGSVGSRWMHDHLRPGMRLRAKGPAGVFHLPRQPDGKYLFISAGSGITPMMSMATVLFERGEEPDISFVTCARRPSELIFRKRLEYMASRLQGLKLHFVVSQDEPYEVWTGYRGRFNQLMLGLTTPDYLERDVYCCGPASFMHAVRDMLHGLGYDMSRYHQESFAAPPERPEDIEAPTDVVPQTGVAAEIEFRRSGRKVACTQDDTVLKVAKAAGLNIPSGCTFGLCGTCKVRLAEGEVHMVPNGGITEEEIAGGLILACCSKPLGRVVVEV
ncbi:MAG: hybrid-cluster NAD(P)-dependent oxidoreductase [Rhodobacteraceae bacterium]|nr:hybrid-cluster NAD(P)-dependent oxidoreductase [Paracoccaceae bacterium]